MRRGAAIVGLVFSAGLGLGFGWHQGWLPIEFPPPNTGVLDESEADSAAGTSVPLIATGDALAETSNGDAEAAPDIERLEGLTEPATKSAPLAPPSAPIRRSAEAAGNVIPAVALTNVAPPSSQQVQATSFEKESSSAATVSSPGAKVPASLDEIDRRIAAGEVLAAHKELSKIYWNEPARRAEIQERIDGTARLIFVAPQPHFVDPHVIQPGDRLEAIAAQHKLSWEYLARLNNVDPKRIRAGQRLKLVRGPFSAVVELNDFSLTVHLQGYYVKRYAIGIGKDGSTPLGKFPVLNKVVNPQYTDPNGKVFDGDDPQNPLGERWIDLGDSYGIHGTIDPDSIGRAASRGCIRLRDIDVVEVFDFLTVGSEVAIRQ